jgi:hypothetical protein
MTKLYTIANITNLIDIPIWVGNAADDTEFPGQSVEVARALGKKATLYNFAGSAGYHCEAGAFQISNLAIFGWLEDVFGAMNCSAAA